MCSQSNPNTPSTAGLTDEEFLLRGTRRMNLTPNVAQMTSTYQMMANSAPKLPQQAPFEQQPAAAAAEQVTVVLVDESSPGPNSLDEHHPLTRICQLVTATILPKDDWRASSRDNSGDEDEPEIGAGDEPGSSPAEFRTKRLSPDCVTSRDGITRPAVQLHEEYIKKTGNKDSGVFLFFGPVDARAVFEGRSRVLRAFEEGRIELIAAVNVRIERDLVSLPASVSFFVRDRKWTREIVAQPCIYAVVADYAIKAGPMQLSVIEDVYWNLPCHSKLMTDHHGAETEYPMRKTFIQEVYLPSTQQPLPTPFKTIHQIILKDEPDALLSRKSADHKGNVLSNLVKAVASSCSSSRR